MSDDRVDALLLDWAETERARAGGAPASLLAAAARLAEPKQPNRRRTLLPVAAAAAVVALALGSAWTVGEFGPGPAPDGPASSSSPLEECPTREQAVPGAASAALAARTTSFFGGTWLLFSQGETPSCRERRDQGGRDRITPFATVTWQQPGDVPGLVTVQAAEYRPAWQQADVVADAEAGPNGYRLVSTSGSPTDGTAIFENAAHRLAVAWDAEGGIARVTDTREGPAGPDGLAPFALTSDSAAQVARAALTPATGADPIPSCPPTTKLPDGQRQSVDYVDFIVHSGVTYLATGAIGGPPPADLAVSAAQIGPLVMTVRCRIADLTAAGDVTAPTNAEGMAAFVPAGTPVHAIVGYTPACRLLVATNGTPRVYLAMKSGGTTAEYEPCALAPRG
jgi:hypothetical protein